MSQGKYSKVCPHANTDYEFKFNARNEIPPEYNVGEEFIEEIHFANYDEEGFDSYGYSAYDEDGKYVGAGQGIDRLGYTEFDYLEMSLYEYVYA